ncbi:23S rRNA (pseudouridine(1915)-N(3))-methyltransferase RlmH [Sediminicoccus sp. BL-A-41-H5]|uniref:23S rRNA (pseudouridine(1915)-N(3))-methyltransferase RlmH n=1 Tax=Sediminicoccus sp. BL-A-41-H5 TaxID=3421106 RepID=UPI003D6795E5
MKARLVTIGRFKSGAEGALFAQYNARLRPPLELTEIPEATGSPAEARRREGAAILAALPANSLLVALDLGGAAPSSEALAQLTGRWEAAARPLCFAIGGAEGLDPAVTQRAEHRLSLGPLTWPHLLVRALLAEQLFRAQCIRANHPYHRAWRP